jgi:hypothetical protein
MSHNPHAAINCPNCGHQAEYNYCAKCGQATHLHKDTFVAHYFHYDSKFWKTLKTLWFKPGALSIAYREKQRMRFIDPISLYIFISAVFFLFFFMSVDNKIAKKDFKPAQETETQYKTVQEVDAEEKAEAIRITNADTSLSAETKNRIIENINNPEKQSAVQKRFKAASRNIKKPEYLRQFVDSLIHSIPKIVFFMIPIMAFVLKLLFIRRGEAFFVDHGIFALHYHTFWFSIMLLLLINPFAIIDTYLAYGIILASMVYFVSALKRNYQISTRKAIVYSMIVGWAYCFFLFFVALFGLIFVFYQQGA